MAYVAPRVSTSRSVEEALAAIDSKPTLFDADDWPEVFAGLAPSGLYAWWVDAAGAKDLSEGLGKPVKKGCIYASQSGATHWPSGIASRHTLSTQVERDELNGNVGQSPFRLTLAAALKKPLKLKKSGPGKLADASEARLSAWMREHLNLAVYQCVNKDELGDLQTRVIGQVKPALNLTAMPKTDLRLELTRLRDSITS
jgi:hypothetical protein